MRQWKRLDSIRRSPIYIHFDETLLGVTCVRAFNKQDEFIARNDQLLDDSQAVFYHIKIANRLVLQKANSCRYIDIWIYREIMYL